MVISIYEASRLGQLTPSVWPKDAGIFSKFASAAFDYTHTSYLYTVFRCFGDSNILTKVVQNQKLNSFDSLAMKNNRSAFRQILLSYKVNHAIFRWILQRIQSCKTLDLSAGIVTYMH